MSKNTLPRFDFSTLPDDVRAILDRLRRRKINFWLVGGFPRDYFGGLRAHRDIDIAVSCNVYKAQHVAGGKVVRGRHPIVKTDGCDLVPVADLREDLLRRDFTVNAMAIDASGALIDPSQGLRDARAHVFRMTRPDLFLEDPVRLARLCRLAARTGWNIDPATATAARRAAARVNRSEVIKNSGLRIGLEIVKSFEDPQPSKFFQLAHSHQVLPLLIPHLEQCFSNGKAQQMEKILELCDRAPVGAPAARMMALLMNLAPMGKSGRAKKSANIARTLLDEFCWDYIINNIYSNGHCWSAQAIVTAIRLQNQDFANRNMDWKALASCPSGSLTLDQFCEMRSESTGQPISALKIHSAQCNILWKGMQKHAPLKEREAALRFYGYSRKTAQKIMRGQLTPSF